MRCQVFDIWKLYFPRTLSTNWIMLKILSYELVPLPLSNISSQFWKPVLCVFCVLDILGQGWCFKVPLVVQWLGLHAPNTGGLGSSLVRELDLHATIMTWNNLINKLILKMLKRKMWCFSSSTDISLTISLSWLVSLVPACFGILQRNRADRMYTHVYKKKFVIRNCSHDRETVKSKELYGQSATWMPKELMVCF